MKFGKLSKADVGQKFRKALWNSDEFFILTFLDEENNFVYGLSKNKTPSAYFNAEWLLWEEEKKTFRIEAAPAVIEIANALSHKGHKKVYQITTDYFSSKEHAEEHFIHNHCFHFIKWPADFDKKKAVWFYEWEE
jgi:hypothetical protein